MNCKYLIISAAVFLVNFQLVFGNEKLGSLAIAIPEVVRHTPYVSRDPEKRKGSAPLLSGDTFRFFCDFIVDETSVEFNPSVIRPGNSIFVSMAYLDFFLLEIFPKIKCPFIIVTSNGSGTIDDRFIPYIQNEKVIKWFGRNIILEHPKVCCIPLGLCWFNPDSFHLLVGEYFNALSKESYFKEKINHTYLNIELTHESRISVAKTFQEKKFCKISRNVGFDIYMSDLAESRFVLSPRGFNIDCYRTWEALYAGSIPVVESYGINELYKDLPVIIVKDMASITKTYLDEEFEKLKEREFCLEKLHIDYWLLLMRKAREDYLLSL